MEHPLIERSRRTEVKYLDLINRYTGMFGALILFPALFTIGPLILGYKYDTFKLNLSWSHFIYAVYHGLGVYLVYSVYLLEYFALSYTSIHPATDLYLVKEKEINGLLWVKRILKLMFPIILLMIGITIFAKASVLINRKYQRKETGIYARRCIYQHYLP